MQDTISDRTDYEPPTSRFGKAYEALYAGYVLVRIRLHEFVRDVGLVDDEIDEKHMSHCEECGELKGWSHGTFGPANDDGFHTAERFDLECGHVDDDPGMRLTEDIVGLFQTTSPEYITVRESEEEGV